MRWRVEASRIVFDRRWLRVREDRVALPNGAVIDEFHVIEAPDWAATVALTERDEVVFVEQYRHGIARTTLELPAGVVEPNEPPLEAARRELLEETGYAADDWEPLIALSPEPNRQPNLAHFFMARGARRVGDPKPDPSEHIFPRVIPTSELGAAISRGDVQHGVHVAALLIAVQKGLFALG